MADYQGKVVLAVGAHPDDVEFGCGATMAMLASQGATTYFATATDGNRGSRQRQFDKAQLVRDRQEEQKAAARILGAKQIFFLEEEDGNLIADIKFKEKIVRLIRQLKPDMIFTHDPAWYYSINPDGKASVNHTDHRACGEAVLDAVYPLARDLQSFPDHATEGLTPHIVPELYLFNFHQPDFVFDVTGHVATQIAAIHAHRSQIDDPEDLKRWMTEHHQKLGQAHQMKEAEGFTQLKFS